MRQFINVLKFELGSYFKNKSFCIVTTMLVLVASMGVTVFALLSGSKDSGGKTGESAPAAGAMAVLDEAGVFSAGESLSELLPMYSWTVCDTEEELRELVRGEDVEAGVVVTGETSYQYIVENNTMFGTAQGVFEEALAAKYRANALSEQGIDAAAVEAVYNTPMESEMIIQGKNSQSNYWYTYVFEFILYMLILFYGQMIATSVTTEKSNRAIEILVTSVNSNSLIFGKVLAGALAGIIQVALILGSAFAAYEIHKNRIGEMLSFLFDIPVLVWVVFAVFGIFGYLLYAFLFGMLGALVSKTEDISKSATPVTLLCVISFIVAMVGMYASDSLLMKIASFIPFTSTNTMLVRVAMGSVEIWEIVVSGAILAASCAGCGVLAAKIFRMGTLMYGNPIKFGNALKMIRNQK